MSRLDLVHGQGGEIPVGTIVTFRCEDCAYEHSVRLTASVPIPPGTLVHTDAGVSGAPTYVVRPADLKPFVSGLQARLHERRDELERAATFGDAADAELRVMDGLETDLRAHAEAYMRATRALAEYAERAVTEYDAESERLLARSREQVERVSAARVMHRTSYGKLYDPKDPEDARHDEALREAERADEALLMGRLAGRRGPLERYAQAACTALAAGKDFLALVAQHRRELEAASLGGRRARQLLSSLPPASGAATAPTPPPPPASATNGVHK